MMTARTKRDFFMKLVKLDCTIILFIGLLILPGMKSIYLPGQHLNVQQGIKESSIDSLQNRKHIPLSDNQYIHFIRSEKDEIGPDTNAASWGANKMADRNMIYTMRNKNVKR